MENGIAIRCGACRGGGWLEGWFKRCARCGGRGWFDPTSAPGGIGPLVAAADAVRTKAARALLVRPALPWERFPIPQEISSKPGSPDEHTWERAVRNSAVVLYEHPDGTSRLAGGLELSRLAETHALLRELLWQTLPDGGLLRCVDRQIRDVYLRLTFFQAWRGEWLEVTRWVEGEKEAEPARSMYGDEITGAAQKYVTGKLFVGPPKEDE